MIRASRKQTAAAMLRAQGRSKPWLEQRIRDRIAHLHSLKRGHEHRLQSEETAAETLINDVSLSSINAELQTLTGRLAAMQKSSL